VNWRASDFAILPFQGASRVIKVQVDSKTQLTVSFDTIHIPRQKSLAICGEKALVITHHHPARIVRKLELHLAKFPHVERFVEAIYDSFDKDELLEVITGLIVISSDIPLLLPCFCTDLGFVNTENG